MKLKLYLLFFLALPSVSVFAQDYLPGDNELLLMPTAYTMPAGNGYFSDYELFLLNYSYSATPTTHISVFSLFPMTTQFYETFTFGVKQKLFTYKLFQTALYGAFTPKSSSYSIGDVVSIGKPQKSFHFSLAYVKYSEHTDADWIYMLGFRLDASKSSSLIIEYENANSMISDEFKGLLTFGVRIRSTHMSWELAGIRPLSSTGNLLFFPLLKVAYYFE